MGKEKTILICKIWVTLTTKNAEHITAPAQKGGVSCSADTFVQAASSVLRMKFSAKNPALRKAPKL